MKTAWDVAADLFDPVGVEDEPESMTSWLTGLFPEYYTAPFGEHHLEFWEWVFSVESLVPPRPFVGIWPRGGAKSTSAEQAVVVLGARRRRRYCLYVCDTQDQADDHVSNIASMLESPQLAAQYPDLADRKVGKYGNSKGWRRNRLRTASGLTVDAIGLDTAARGAKLEADRPDVFVLDDIDTETDTPAITQRKINQLTKKLLPARSPDAAVIAIQNLVHEDSIFSRLADGRADFLADRIVSGPLPALRDLEYELDPKQGKYVITKGNPVWVGQGVAECQALMDLIGVTAFLSEAQHDVTPPAGGLFDHLDYQHREYLEIKDFLERVVCWVDPAVSTTDRSDSMAIQIDGMAGDGKVYRLYSWERRATPKEALVHALRKAREFKASKVGVETDQGGDAWISVYQEACREVGFRLPFDSAKAGPIGSKIHRASMMLTDYEIGQIVHCYGTHTTLERALNRFPKSKPYDLVDAAFWSWYDLTTLDISGTIVEEDDPGVQISPV